MTISKYQNESGYLSKHQNRSGYLKASWSKSGCLKLWYKWWSLNTKVDISKCGYLKLLKVVISYHDKWSSLNIKIKKWLSQIIENRNPEPKGTQKWKTGGPKTPKSGQKSKNIVKKWWKSWKSRKNIKKCSEFLRVEKLKNE